jgi:hypothetical protein
VKRVGPEGEVRTARVLQMRTPVDVTVLICFSVCVGHRIDSGIQALVQYCSAGVDHPPCPAHETLFSGAFVSRLNGGAPDHRLEFELWGVMSGPAREP